MTSPADNRPETLQAPREYPRTVRTIVVIGGGFVLTMVVVVIVRMFQWVFAP